MGRKRGSMAFCRARAKARPRAKDKANRKDKAVIGEGDHFANLPSSIITNHIMLQLPIKTLVICRLVCKTWNALISDPYFARLHHQCAPLSVMIRINVNPQMSRTLYLLEPGRFESMARVNDLHRVSRTQLEMFERNRNNCLKLGPAFKLPLERLHHRSYLIRDFHVVNSCNGLLCLCSPCNTDLVICNPVTCEFIKLPISTEIENFFGCDTGFGFQPKTNEYKVVRIWGKYSQRSFVVQIHTLGKPGWRNVGVDNEFLTKIDHLQFPTCVNGALHWLNIDWLERRSILCFNFESEGFQSFPPIPQDGIFGRFNLAELGGFLYLFNSSSIHSCIMWVMKSYGVGGSWTKVFSIDNLGECFWPYDLCWSYSLCWPIKHVEKGVAILMQTDNYLIYYEIENKVYKLFRNSKSLAIIPHIPSLALLKDLVTGDNIEVLNFHSRCFELKLQEKYDDDEVLFLT